MNSFPDGSDGSFSFAEKDLHKSERWFQKLFDESVACNLVVSADAEKIILANRRFMETFGLAEADLHDLEGLLHKTLPDSQYRAERFASLRKDIAVLGDEESASSVAFTKLRVADGGERHFERRIARLDDYILLTLLDVSDRVLALKALEQEKRFNESLIASLPGIFYAFDEKGQLIRWNETFKQISGGVQVQGGLSPLVAPEDRAALVSAERSAMEKGYAEAEVRIKSGPEPTAPDFWHAVTLVPITIGQDRFLIGTGVNIHHRKLTEQRLSLLQSILQAVSESKDYEGALSIALKSICQATGCTYGETWIPAPDGSRLERGPDWMENTEELRRFAEASKDYSFRPGEGLPGSVWARKEALWHQDLFQEELSPIVRSEEFKRSGLRSLWAIPVQHDGQAIAVLVFGLPKIAHHTEELIQLASSVVQAMGTIILRKKTEDEIRTLSFAVQQSPVSIVITNRQGSIEFVNPRFTQVTGYTPEDALGKDPSVMKSGKHSKQFYRDLWKTIQRGNVWNGEFINKKKDGSEYYEQAAIGPVLNEQGVISHFVAVKEDITERKLREEQMRQSQIQAESANRAKSAFLATMSHEIRTPMNAIIGLSYLALESSLDPRQREYLEKIRDSGKNLLEILNDILDFSKIEAGRMDIESALFDLPHLVESSVDSFRERALKKNVYLRCIADPRLPRHVVGDSTRLRQVLNNLVGNAVKFTESGGVVVSSALLEAKDDSIVLRCTVEDTGIGMSEEEQQNLFHPFVQVDSSMSRRYGGTGLGLAISKALVLQMGGGIALKSEKGKGSSFEFTCTFLRAQAGDVPAPSSMDPEPEAAYSRTLPESGASAPRQKTILLVEDNDLNLQITRELLSKKSYRILEAVDGTKAIETVQRALSEGAALDMILMDLRMPVLDGYQTTAILRKMDELKGIPIIAMTADVRNNVREAVFQAGMDDFLSKPINPPDLFEMVEKHLARTAKAGGPSECPDSVPGIRIEEGVRRVGGDRVFYYSILKQFAANYSGEAEKLEASFSSGDMKTLVLLAHTMKGAAATIGAGPLADRAEELQRMASANDPVPTEDISRGIKEFSESLDAVLSSIDSVLGDTAVQEAAEDCSADAAAPTLPKLISLGAEEYGRARFLCGRIGECVLQDIPATRRSMDELGILLKDTEYYRDYAALARCIQEFEIIAARDSARVLGERLVNGGNRANA